MSELNSGSFQKVLSSDAPLFAVVEQSLRLTSAPLSGQRWVIGSDFKPSEHAISKTYS